MPEPTGDNGFHARKRLRDWELLTGMLQERSMASLGVPRDTRPHVRLYGM